MFKTFNVFISYEPPLKIELVADIILGSVHKSSLPSTAEIKHKNDPRSLPADFSRPQRNVCTSLIRKAKSNYHLVTVI